MIPGVDISARVPGPDSPDWSDPLFRLLAVHGVMTAEASCSLDTSLYPNEMRECRRLSWAERWPTLRFATEQASRSGQDADQVPGASRLTRSVYAVVYGSPGTVGETEALASRPRPPERVPRVPNFPPHMMREVMRMCSVGARGAVVPVLEHMFREIRGLVDAVPYPSSSRLSDAAAVTRSVFHDVIKAQLLA